MSNLKDELFENVLFVCMLMLGLIGVFATFTSQLWWGWNNSIQKVEKQYIKEETGYDLDLPN